MRASEDKTLTEKTNSATAARTTEPMALAKDLRRWPAP